MERLMKKKEYRQIIVNQTKIIRGLEEKNEALKEQSKKLNASHRRNRLKIIGGLSALSNQMGGECMIPESEVVQKCIEVVKAYYV